MNVPTPLPSVVLLSEMVGLDAVPQQTPLSVTGAPPSLEIFPPPDAEEEVINEIADVVRVGSRGFVVKLTSVP